MVKVRLPRIDEESSDDKPRRKYQRNVEKKSKDESGAKTESDEEEDEEARPLKTMLRLDDFDTTISLYGIECIEKKMRFVEKPSAHFQYGIIINGGMEPSMRYPKTNIEAWYERMEKRDERYDYLLEILTKYRIKVLQL